MTEDEVRPIRDTVLVRPDAKIAETVPRANAFSGRTEGFVIPQTVLADNPNYYTMTGVVVRLGDGVREDIYECCNRQCRHECRRMVGERCPLCGATQVFRESGSGVHGFDVQVGDRVMFGRFAGKQIEIDEADGTVRYLMMRELEILAVVTGDERIQPGYERAAWGTPSAGATPVQRVD